MPKTNWQDHRDEEILSIHITGLQDAVGKMEDALGLGTIEETDVSLIMVPAYNTSGILEYRIYQAPVGKRNWLASSAPVVKKNGSVITTGFSIDYGGGAILLDSTALNTDTFTASFTRTNSTPAVSAGNVTQDATHRFVADTEKESWNNKLDSVADGSITDVKLSGEAGQIKQVVNNHLADGVHQKISVTDTTDATSIIDAPLKSAGGLAVAKKSYFGDSLSIEDVIFKNYNVDIFDNAAVAKIAYTGVSYQMFSARVVINCRQAATPYPVSQKEVLIHTFFNNGSHLGQTITTIRELGVGANITVAFTQTSGNNHEIQISNGTGAEQTYLSVFVEAMGVSLLNGFGSLTIV